MPKKTKETEKEASVAYLSPKQHDLNIVMRKLEELKPWDKNPRKHDKLQIEKLAKLIQQFGFYNPIMLDEESSVLAGHGRIEALQLLGRDMGETRTLYGLSHEEKTALVLADNRSALDATWDDEFVKYHLGVLNEAEFPLDLTGFSTPEIKDFLAFGISSGGLTDPDAVPAQPATPKSKPGDVWILGDHRIACGNCDDPNILDALMKGEKADLLFTDPPYGVAFEQGKYSPTAGKNFRGKKIENDERTGDDLVQWIAGIFGLIKDYTKGCAFYCWAPSMLQGYDIHKGLVQAGWKVQSQIIWKKSSLVLGRSDYQWQHEICWYGFKQKEEHAWYGGRTQTTIWEVKKMSKVELHPTQKPVELAEIALKNSTKPGDVILDPFSGSGMTLIACETLGRVARGIDLDPGYVDVMVRRWEEFTGKKATLESTGETFR